MTRTKVPPAALIFPVAVVQAFRTVQTQADQKIVVMEEPAPLVVKQDAVGLEGIRDHDARLREAFLEGNGASEKNRVPSASAPPPCQATVTCDAWGSGKKVGGYRRHGLRRTCENYCPGTIFPSSGRNNIHS